MEIAPICSSLFYSDLVNGLVALMNSNVSSPVNLVSMSAPLSWVTVHWSTPPLFSPLPLILISRKNKLNKKRSFHYEECILPCTLFINKKTKPLDIEILQFQEQDIFAGVFICSSKKMCVIGIWRKKIYGGHMLSAPRKLLKTDFSEKKSTEGILSSR